ncbi:MAG: hypothetical protein Q9224_003718 [Gallowayella concinna]
MVLSSTVHSAKLGDMKPAFNTVGQGLGSCTTDRIKKLEDSFREAVEATQQAVHAIENLKKSAPMKLLNKGPRQTWKRQAQLLKALFNIDVDKSKGLGSGNLDANTVQTNFQNMLDGLNYENPNVIRKYWIFCGDDWVQWKEATDIDQLDTEDPKRSIGTIHGVGLYLIKVHTPVTSLVRYVKILGASQPHPMCRGNNFAGTLSRMGAIAFCDVSFDSKYKDLSTTKSQIQPGDHLDDKLTLAHLWIHEWGHLFNDLRDEVGVDRLGNMINEHANGWQRAVNLARWDSNRARTAPDSYALFATTVYFDNYGWGNGVAVKD